MEFSSDVNVSIYNEFRKSVCAKVKISFFRFYTLPTIDPREQGSMCFVLWLLQNLTQQL
jgi:hypothetical protein